MQCVIPLHIICLPLTDYNTHGWMCALLVVVSGRVHSFFYVKECLVLVGTGVFVCGSKGFVGLEKRL